MNKKQLQESIMAGVTQALKENKVLNEGFFAWKEKNVPKINYDIFNQNVKDLAAIIQNLIKSKDVFGVSIVYHDNISASWKGLVQAISTEEDVNLVTIINDALKRFKESFNADEEKVASSINDLYIKIYIPKESHLMKYIASTINPGSNKIQDKPYFSLLKGDGNNNILRFSLNTLIDDEGRTGKAIIEYFS